MDKAHDPYTDLARYYDAENADLVEDLPAYATLVERFGGPVLDLGCGTGRVTFYLAQHKTYVVGVDISQDMITRARERATRQKFPAGRVNWLRANVTELSLNMDFGLAIFAYHGFMHLLEPDQQIAALERIGAHLKPGGGVAIDLPNPIEIFRASDVAALVLERTFHDPQSGQTVMQQSLASVDRATQILELIWVYDRIGDNGLVHRDIIPLKLRYTTAQEIKLLLRCAGLQLEGLYGNYDFEPYREDSPHLFVIATKTGMNQ